MPKKLKNVFYKKLEFQYFLEAHKRASKNKHNKKEVMLFELDLETNLINLINAIKKGKYKLGEYRKFTIYEPKMRLIKSLPYRDRIVHQWYIEEFIKPCIQKHFISDSYACITGRGNHKAVYKTQKYMRIMKRKYGSYYILKCDIQKFFYNIDKDILFKILSKYIADLDLLKFTHLLLYSKDKSHIGIPIGNYTSQFFANIYLNELDRYVKRELKIKFYIRYMDDFIILLDQKEDCKKVKTLIENFISKHLHLCLNNKSRYYPSKMGVDFCGFHIFETHMLVRKRCKKKINQKIKLWNFLYNQKKLNEKEMLLSLNSWSSHIKHASSFNLKKVMLDKIEFKDLIFK